MANNGSTKVSIKYCNSRRNNTESNKPTKSCICNAKGSPGKYRLQLLKVKKTKIPCQFRVRLLIKKFHGRRKECKCGKHPKKSKFILKPFYKTILGSFMPVRQRKYSGLQPSLRRALSFPTKLRIILSPKSTLPGRFSARQPRRSVAPAEILSVSEPYLHKPVSYDAESIQEEQSWYSERNNTESNKPTKSCICNAKGSPGKYRLQLLKVKKTKIPCQFRVRLLIKKFHGRRKECKCGKHPKKSKFILKPFYKTILGSFMPVRQRKYSGLQPSLRRALSFPTKLRIILSPKSTLPGRFSARQPRRSVAPAEILSVSEPYLHKPVSYDAESIQEEQSWYSERNHMENTKTTTSCTWEATNSPRQYRLRILKLKKTNIPKQVRIRLLIKKKCVCSKYPWKTEFVLKLLDKSILSSSMPIKQQEGIGSSATLRRTLNFPTKSRTILSIRRILPRRASASQHRQSVTSTKRVSVSEPHLRKPVSFATDIVPKQKTPIPESKRFGEPIYEKYDITEEKPSQIEEEAVTSGEIIGSEPTADKRLSEPKYEKSDLTEERPSQIKETPIGETVEKPSRRSLAAEDPDDHSPRRQQGSERKSRKCSCGVGTRGTLRDSELGSTQRRLSEGEDEHPSRESETRKTKCRWHTWAITRHLGGPKHFVRVSCRELFLYLIFLFLMIWVLLEEWNFNKYIHCKLIMERFTKTLYKTNSSSVNSTGHIYYSMESIPNLWCYLMQHFLPVVSLYNAKNLLSVNGSSGPASSVAVGAPRIRQVRVVNDSCVVPDVFHGWYNFCYYYFHPKYEDKQTFGSATNQAWSWRKNQGVHYYFGKISIYSPNGYYVDLPTADNATNILSGLLNESWVDRATRAVFIDFNIYSPDANLFSAAKLVMELPPSGGIFPTASCYSMKLISPTFRDWIKLFSQPKTIWNALYIICGIIFIIFILYFILIVIRDVSHFGCSYLLTFWGFLDVTILLFIFGVIAVLFIKESYTTVYLPKLSNSIKKDNYISLDTLVTIYTVFSILLGILNILCWIKLVKFFAMFTRVSMMFTAIYQSKKQLMILFNVALILLIGFAIFAHLYFGLQVEEFSSVGSSFFSLLTIPLGGLYYYESMDTGRPIIAPLFLLFFIFTFIVIVWLLFMAVIVHGTKKAEEIFALSGPYGRFGPCEYLHNSAVLCFAKCKCRRLSRYLRRKLKLKLLRMRHSLLLALIRKFGIHGLEIQLFLKRHGIQYGYDVTSRQLTKILTDLKTKQYLLYRETIEHEKLVEQLEILQIRIEIIDKELYNVAFR